MFAGSIMPWVGGVAEPEAAATSPAWTSQLQLQLICRAARGQSGGLWGCPELCTNKGLGTRARAPGGSVPRLPGAQDSGSWSPGAVLGPLQAGVEEIAACAWHGLQVSAALLPTGAFQRWEQWSRSWA